MVSPFWGFGPDPPFTHTIFSDEVESSGSDDDDDDFVLDALEFSDPIADKSGDEGDEDVGEVFEEDESSEYTESSSDEEVEVDASIAASTVDTNIRDTNSNVFRGNVDIKVEHYDVDQDRHWTKKDKNQIDTLFASPEGKFD